VALTEGADTARVEIADARAYVARN
jgi:hypothetical protein